MKMIFSLTIISVTLLLSGWKNDPPAGSKKTVWKKLMQTSIKADQSITYHNDGMPETISWSQAGSVYKKTFSYAPGKISYIVTANNKKFEQGVFTVVNGQIVRLNWNRVSGNGENENIYSETFLYNEMGLLKKHSFNKAWSEFEYDNDGDLVRTAHFDGAGKPTTVVEYTYTDIEDQFPALGYFNSDGSGFFLPRFSKHLPATRKVTRASNKEVTLKGRFIYQLDTDGYILNGKWDATTTGDADFEWTNRFQ